MISMRLLTLLLLAASAGGATAEGGLSGNPAVAWRDGGQVYQKVCAHCHEAGVGPVIKGRSLPTLYIERVVRHGNRAMPSFRPSEIDDVALADVARVISTAAVANAPAKP